MRWPLKAAGVVLGSAGVVASMTLVSGAAAVVIAAESGANHAPSALPDSDAFGNEQVIPAPPGADRTFGDLVQIDGHRAVAAGYFSREITALARGADGWEVAQRLQPGRSDTRVRDLAVDGDLLVASLASGDGVDPPYDPSAAVLAVYERVASTWREGGPVVVDWPTGTRGVVGEVSTEGGRVLVTAELYGPAAGGSNQRIESQAILLTRTARGWSQEVVLATPARIVEAQLVSGRVVAIIGDGTPMTAHVWEPSAAGWERTATLCQLVQEEGGWSLAGEGDTVVVGDGSSSRVRVFDLVDGDWRESQDTISRDPQGLYFGMSLAFDRGVLVVGDGQYAPGPGSSGVWLFHRSQGEWPQVHFGTSASSTSSPGSFVDVSRGTVMIGRPVLHGPGEGSVAFLSAGPYRSFADEVLSVDAPGVLANDTDQDGDRLTAHLVDAPDHGTVSLRPDGSFTYRPDAGWTGLDAFEYVAADPQVKSEPTEVVVRVRERPPAGQDQGPGVLQEGSVTTSTPPTASIGGGEPQRNPEQVAPSPQSAVRAEAAPAPAPPDPSGFGNALLVALVIGGLGLGALGWMVYRSSRDA